MAATDIHSRTSLTPFQDILPPAPTVTEEVSRLETWVFGDLAATVEAVYGWKASQDSRLTSELLADHWLQFYRIHASLEAKALAQSPLDGKVSAWPFPLTLIIPPTAADYDSKSVLHALCAAVSANPESAATVDSTDMLAAITWDGAAVFIREPSEATVEAATFLMRFICVDWHIHEEAGNRARCLLTTSSDPGKRLIDIRNTTERFYHGLAVLEPSQLSYQESDIAFLEAAWVGWRRAGLNTRTTQLLDRLHRLYEFDLEQRRTAEQEDQARRATALNYVVGWIGVVGVAGATASVVSSVDHRNNLVDSTGRLVLILSSLAVSAAALLYFLFFARARDLRSGSSKER